MYEENDGREGFYRIRLAQEKGTKTKRDKWTASHPDLLGCHVVRDDPTIAVGDLGEVREEWIARARARDERIPEPKRDLHYTLVLDSEHTPTDAEMARAALQTAAVEVETLWYDSEFVPS